MKKIRNSALILTGALLLSVLSGCSRLFAATRDITDFKLISILGIDADKEEKLKLTASAKEDSKPDGGSETDKPFILTNSAATVSKAFAEMQTLTDKHLYLGHDRYCIIGEEAAKRGIGAVLDFFERDPNARLDTKLFIVRDETAENLLTKASGGSSFAADRLASMENDMRKLAKSGMTSVVDISNALDETGAAAVRALKLVPKTEHDGSAEEEQFDFEPDGYAIIADGRLKAFMPSGDAAGYSLLNGKNYYDLLEVNAPDGKPVSLKMEKARRGIEVEWENGKPVSLTVKISFKTVLEETHSEKTVNDREFLDALAKAQSELIKKKAEAVVSMSQKTGTDFTGIGGAVNRRHPVRFSAVKDNWNEIWKELAVAIEVDSAVVSTYNIVEPDRRKEKTA